MPRGRWGRYVICKADRRVFSADSRPPRVGPFRVGGYACGAVLCAGRRVSTRFMILTSRTWQRCSFVPVFAEEVGERRCCMPFESVVFGRPKSRPDCLEAGARQNPRTTTDI